MKRRFCLGFALLSVLGICCGILGCGKGESAKDSVSIPVEIGEHLNFGNYKGEEIEWRVLDVKDGNVLLLSKYGLDVQPYNKTKGTDIDWKDCTLRQWLNDEFYEEAFSEEEQEKIVLSTSEGIPEHNYRGIGGKFAYRERETEDHVFLLSYTELYHYISSDNSENVLDSKRFCYPTEYVKNNFDLTLYKDACGWWLCSVNQDVPEGCRPMFVAAYTHIEQVTGATGITRMDYAVRPAIWIEWQDGPRITNL